MEHSEVEGKGLDIILTYLQHHNAGRIGTTDEALRDMGLEVKERNHIIKLLAKIDGYVDSITLALHRAKGRLEDDGEWQPDLFGNMNGSNGHMNN